jgi:hypothetical protein
MTCVDSDVAEDHDRVLVDLVVGAAQARHQRRQPALAHNLGGVVRRRREVPQRQQRLLFRSVVLRVQSVRSVSICTFVPVKQVK